MRLGRALAVVVALLGALLMWYSTELGYNAGSSRSDIQGAVIYQHDALKQEGYMVSLRWMGAVMLGVGLYRALDFAKERSHG